MKKLIDIACLVTWVINEPNTTYNAISSAAHSFISVLHACEHFFFSFSTGIYVTSVHYTNVARVLRLEQLRSHIAARLQWVMWWRHQYAGTITGIALKPAKYFNVFFFGVWWAYSFYLLPWAWDGVLEHPVYQLRYHPAFLTLSDLERRFMKPGAFT